MSIPVGVVDVTNCLYDMNDNKKKMDERHSALPTTPATYIVWNVMFYSLIIQIFV